MSILIFAASLILLTVLLDRYTLQHSLDSVQQQLNTELLLLEPGQQTTLHIMLRNTSRRTLPYLHVWFHLSSEICPLEPTHTKKDRIGGGCTFSCSFWLRPYEETEFQIPVSIQKRGRYVLEQLTVSGGDLLGLRTRSRTGKTFLELVVPPLPCRQLNALTAVGSIVGDILIQRFIHEDPILTTGYREYTGQEPMRDISWTQSARACRLMVRQHDHTAEPRVMVLFHAGGTDAEFEDCCSLVRSLCSELEQKAVPYSMQINAFFDLLMNKMLFGVQTVQLQQGLGPAHFARALELLGRAANWTTASCSAFLEKAVSGRQSQSCILVTARSACPDPALLKDLERRTGCRFYLLVPEEVCGE